MQTRSPLRTPASRSTLAKRFTNRANSSNVKRRSSPSSPTQINAVFVRLGPSKCRSSTFCVILHCEPANHSV